MEVHRSYKKPRLQFLGIIAFENELYRFKNKQDSIHFDCTKYNDFK